MKENKKIISTNEKNYFYYTFCFFAFLNCNRGGVRGAGWGRPKKYGKEK